MRGSVSAISFVSAESSYAPRPLQALCFCRSSTPLPRAVSARIYSSAVKSPMVAAENSPLLDISSAAIFVICSFVGK